MTPTDPAEEAAEPDNPNFFALASPTDPVARLQLQEQRFEYLKWRSVLPSDQETRERDFTEYAATLTRSTGQTARFIADNLYALITLERLPRLEELVEGSFIVDMRRLRTIENQTKGARPEITADPAFWDALDERLLQLFSPSRPNQLVPETGKIANAVKEILRAFTPTEPEPDTEESDESEDEQAEQHPEFTAGYQSWQQPDGSVSIELRVDQTTATMIEEAVRVRAAAEDIPRSQALIELILANVAVSIALNLFQASDLPEVPGFLQPFGPLAREDTEQLAKLAKVIRDADQVGGKVGRSYQPGADIRAHVEGRDRVCRWPGCQVPAHRCQTDHRINFADGGQTTAGQMISVCQHHHNRKTDEQASYLLDPVAGDVYWLFGDGTWTVDLADGPLAPRQKRWAQTLAQKLQRRQERARGKDAGKATRRKPKEMGEEKPPF